MASPTDTRQLKPLEQSYKIHHFRLCSTHLDIYEVRNANNQIFEAQVFPLSVLKYGGDTGTGADGDGNSSTNSGTNSNSKRHSNLLESLSRRMRRINHSDSFAGSFDYGGKVCLVFKPRRSKSEWEDLCRQVMKHEGGGGYQGKYATAAAAAAAAAAEAEAAQKNSEVKEETEQQSSDRPLSWWDRDA